MAILLPNSIFYHIPRTGGTWVTEVLEKMFPSARDYRGNGLSTPTKIDTRHISPRQALTEHTVGKKSFAFVREPVSWYRSYWVMDRGYRRPVAENGLIKYMENKFEKFPEGEFTYYLKLFLGEDLKMVDFVGRQEFLREDLLSILELVEKDFDRDLIFTVPKRNGGHPQLLKEAVFPGWLRKKIIKTEKWVYDHFPYMGEATENEK